MAAALAVEQVVRWAEAVMVVAVWAVDATVEARAEVLRVTAMQGVEAREVATVVAVGVATAVVGLVAW